MKNFIVILIAAVSWGLISGTLQTVLETENINDAKVQKFENVYVFIKSDPVNNYNVIGTLKSPKIVKSNTLTGMLQYFIKKANKEYNDYDALIFNDTKGMESAIVIKFK